MLFSHALKDMGASEVIGIDLVDRSGVASKFHVDRSICSFSREWALSLSPDERPSIVIEAVGHQAQTVNDAIEAIGMFGQLFVFGIIDETHYAVEFKKILDKEITVYAGRTQAHRKYLEAAKRYVCQYPELAEHFITHMLSVKDAEVAFRLACSPASGQIKVVLVP